MNLHQFKFVQEAVRRNLNLTEAAKYPYKQAYLPYNRLPDGTVHDW